MSTNDIAKYIEKWIDDVMSSINKQNKGVNATIIDYLHELMFDENGDLVSNQNIFENIHNLTTDIDKLVKKTNITGTSYDDVKNILGISKTNLIKFNKKNGLKIPKIGDEYLDYVSNQISTDFSDVFLADRYKKYAVKIIQEKVVLGKSIRDIRKEFNQNNTGNSDVEKYSRQILNDSAMSVPRYVNNLVAENNPTTNGILYSGGLRTTSRPLCLKIIQDYKGRISNDELKILLADPDMQKGLIDGTTVDNFKTVCGGYNCNHIATPIFIKIK